jgi:hypothetical protein
MTGLAAAFVPLLFLQAIFIAPLIAPNDSLATSIGASDKPWISALHVLNALFIFWLVTRWVQLVRRDLERMRRAGRPARVDQPAADAVAGSPAQ